MFRMPLWFAPDVTSLRITSLTSLLLLIEWFIYLKVLFRNFDAIFVKTESRIIAQCGRACNNIDSVNLAYRILFILIFFFLHFIIIDLFCADIFFL